MTTPKFTPGPWACVDDTVYALDDGVNRFSALVQGWPAPDSEIHANAVLMAASPELYESLCDAVKTLEKLDKFGWDFGKLPKYKAALSKARGES